MSIDWKQLVGVRDRQREKAEEVVAHERRLVAARESRQRDAERQWQQQVQAKLRHEQTTRLALSSRPCSVADLRHASDGHRALDLDIAREAHALQQAQAEVMQQRRVLAHSLQRLREASAGLEKAQRMHEQVKSQCTRLRMLRLEEAVEEASLRVWTGRYDG